MFKTWKLQSLECKGMRGGGGGGGEGGGQFSKG